MNNTIVRCIIVVVMLMESKFNYQLIQCKSALNKINSFLPYHWDLNIYRGCEHNCAYCFAQYSHRYLDDNDFFHNIYIKENITEQLEKKLGSKTWKKDVVNLGGVTDSYQPVEKEKRIMPSVLETLIKYQTPAIISTKSQLILRDIELIKMLKEKAGIQVALTITTLDQDVASILEPNASSVKERVKTIKILKEAGIEVGWHLMPIIPFITATRSNLENIFKVASRCKVDYIITGMLNLRGSTRKSFFKFIKDNYPEKYDNIWRVYNDASYKKEYKMKLGILLNELAKKYNVSRDYKRFVPAVKESESARQISFLDVEKR